MRTGDTKERIEIIQVLRLVCSVMIILFHSDVIGMHGYFAADIFSVLSGFILMYTTKGKQSSRFFLYNRWIRIVPLYWFFTFITYFLIRIMPQISLMSEAKISYLLKSMFFIPFVNGKGASVPMMGVGWTLNYEMFFCVIFWLAMKMNHKLRGVISSVIVIVLVGAGEVFKIEPYFIRYYTDSFLLEFVFGIVIFYIKDFVTEAVKNRSVKISGYGIFLLSWGALLMDLGVETDIIRGFRIGLPSFFIVLLCISFFEKKTFPPLLAGLGNATYSIYLLEYFTTALYKAIAIYVGAGLKVILFMGMFLGTLLGGWLLYHLAEKPSYRFLKKYSDRIKGNI